MEEMERKTEEVMNFLKRSRPELKHREILTEKIMREVKYAKRAPGFPSALWDYLFGWAYIGWVRRSLITVSVVVLLIFVYQQSVIIRRINAIDRQIVPSAGLEGRMVSGKTEGRSIIRRLENMLPVDNKKLNEKEIDDLIESVNSLQLKYRDLLKIIDEDPELRKYLEKKLNEKNVK